MEKTELTQYWEHLVSMKADFLLASWETFIMVAVSSLIGIIFGLILGVILRLTAKNQLWENAFFHRTLGIIVDFARAFPFVILMIALTGFARVIIGKGIGPYAASVSLSVAAIPYFARLVEQSLREVPKGIIEAAQAMGASDLRIIFRVLLTEARAGLISGATILIVSILGYSAAAGMLGGGGLGDLAIRFGHYRGQRDVIFAVVILLSILVVMIQIIGNFLARKLDKR